MERKNILEYLENHTYKDTCEKYGISETTLSRWRKKINERKKKNRLKIIISLPKFWLEYLNKEIESDVWEDYSDAILSIIRYYSKSQKSIQQADSKYLEKVKEIIPNLENLNPNIDSMLLSSPNEVIHKTERWESTDGIRDLIEIWRKASSGKLRECEFQNETYYVRDISVKHLVGVKKSQTSSYLLGLKRKLTETNIYILAIAHDIEENSLLYAMNALKRAAMGFLPTISEESHGKSSKFTEGFQRIPSSHHLEIWSKEQERVFQIKEVEGKEIRVETLTVEGKFFESTITLEEMDFARMFCVRAAFRHYNSFINPSPDPVKSIFTVTPMKGNNEELSFCGTGVLNPITICHPAISER